MVKEIQLDESVIKVYQYDEEEVDGRSFISVGFKVSSEEYHDVTMLLYRETFDVTVPERNLKFKGKIVQFWTSITNLYQVGNVGDYQLRLQEIDQEDGRG